MNRGKAVLVQQKSISWEGIGRQAMRYRSRWQGAEGGKG